MTDPLCDAAFWDVSGTLLGDLRAKLKHRTAHRGEKIVVEAGEWLGRRLVIGMPKRLIARQVPRLADSLAALIAAHRPRRLFVVGPAATAEATGRLGEVVTSETTFDTATDPIGHGVLQADATRSRVTTDWAGDVRQASQELGVEVGLLAVVTVQGNRRKLTPPASRRRTLSRDAGALLGKLLAGRASGDGVPPLARAAVVKTIEAVLLAD